MELIFTNRILLEVINRFLFIKKIISGLEILEKYKSETQNNYLKNIVQFANLS
jgi:hypothetical protein